jgi:hypothetical protein
VIAQFESETAESVRLSGRLQAYGAVFGGLLQIYSAVSTVTDALKFSSEGTIWGDAQRNADRLESQSKQDLAGAQTLTDGVQLLQAVASVADAQGRGDQEALFDLSGSLGDFGMSLTKSADQLAAMQADLSLRLGGLAVVEQYFGTIMKLPMDPLAGTIPQANAFMIHESIVKFTGSLRVAADNYKSAATLLNFYANFTVGLAHEANKSAWTLVLRRLAQAGAKAQSMATAPRPPMGAHSTPPGVRLDPNAGRFPTVEEQRGKTPCPTCHDQPVQKSAFDLKKEMQREPSPEEMELLKQWAEAQNK